MIREEETGLVNPENFKLAVQAGIEASEKPFPTSKDFARYINSLRLTLEDVLEGRQSKQESIEDVERFFERYGMLQFRRAQSLASLPY